MKKSIILALSALVVSSVSCVLYLSDKKTFVSTSTSSFPKWLTMRLKEGDYPPVSRAEVGSVSQNVAMDLINSPSTVPRATWIGHATVLVQYHGINYLTDPHLTERPAPIDFLVPKRLAPPAIPFGEMPKIDFIVISHNHYDHLDHRTVDMFGNSVMWYVPMGLKAWFVGRGIDARRVVELDWWQSHPFNKAVKVTFTPSVHWSKRVPWDTNTSLWGSWSVDIDGFKTWFAGDTAYDAQLFKEIGRRTGPYHMAFIPIGAYGPRYFMLKQHVDPYQAMLIHKDIRSRVSIPIHWGTFQLTHEPYLEPPRLLVDAMQKENLPIDQFKPLNIGTTLEIDMATGLAGGN